jgi:hypothetical protein
VHLFGQEFYHIWRIDFVMLPHGDDRLSDWNAEPGGRLILLSGVPISRLGWPVLAIGNYLK